MQCLLLCGLLLQSSGCGKEGEPEVKTMEVVNVTPSSAKSGGQVLKEGGSNVTQRGHVWDTLPNPSLERHVGTTEEGIGKGFFISDMHQLEPKTTYFVRAYATNQYGTRYGEELVFETRNRQGIPCPGLSTVVDYNGNIYQTVQIGGQCWLQQNLNVRNYRDGTPIPVVEEVDEWSYLNTGAMCWYENNPLYFGARYGALYNWFAVADPRGLCPEGWRVATDTDWKLLEFALGIPSADLDKTGFRGFIAGDLKEQGTTHWVDHPTTGSTNSSGFTARAAGFNEPLKGFMAVKNIAGWWCSTSAGPTSAWTRLLTAQSPQVNRNPGHVNYGLSVRCIKE